MRNEASKTRTLDVAFVVNEAQLRSLATILGETSDKLEYTVTFSDGTTVKYGDIADVIGQPNSKERSIVSLIAGTADERVKSAFMNLKKDSSPSIEYTIYGSQRDVVYFASQLDDWISGVGKWYSLFLSSEKNSTPAGFALAIALFALPIITWGQIAKLSSTLAQNGSYQWIALPAMAAMGVVEYYVVRLFPRGTFATGDGGQRSRFNVYVRNTILAVLLSVIAGVIANWLTKHF